MKLYINSIKNNSTQIEVKLLQEGEVVAEKVVEARYRQAENLLPLIAEVIGGDHKKEEIESIEVENEGGTFTSVRIGVTVANALGYAWGAPVKGTSSEKKEKEVAGITITRPGYDREPNITV